MHDDNAREGEDGVISEHGWDWEQRERRREAAAARYERLRQARLKGTHTSLEWKALQLALGFCVGCGISFECLYGGEPTKDHIVSLTDDGCDCIANIQPLCRECNSRKKHASADFRRHVDSEWVQRFICI